MLLNSEAKAAKKRTLSRNLKIKIYGITDGKAYS